MKKKNIIIISSIIGVIIIASIIGVIISNNSKKNENAGSEDSEAVSRLSQLYDKLNQAESYTFKTTLNDQNSFSVAKQGESALAESYDEGEKDTYLVKGEDTYLLVENTKKYYTYANNTTYLAKITNDMEDVLDKEFTTGKEKIDNKEYYYEEFNEVYPFIINYKKSIDESTTKTRLYFEGDNLKYIKTYVGDVQQLLKVDISYDKIDNNKFDIPKDYEKSE